MKLTAKNVEKVFLDCLFKDGEDTSGHIAAHGAMLKVGFHPDRLKTHEQDVKDLLTDLPEGFQKGWSFLQACETKDGTLWGQHQNIDQLLTLGLALGLVAFCAPREMWGALPGGMPYFLVKP